MKNTNKKVQKLVREILRLVHEGNWNAKDLARMSALKEADVEPVFCGGVLSIAAVKGLVFSLGIDTTTIFTKPTNCGWVEKHYDAFREMDELLNDGIEICTTKD